MVPAEYLATSSPSPQTGGVAPTKVPQSVTVRLSLADSGLVLSESTGAVRESVKEPLRPPVFWMSTVPVELLPGRRLLAVSTAVPSLELRMLSVPAEKVFAGLAEEAVKSAPEPTTAAAASSSVSRAPSASRGLAARKRRRDIGTDSSCAGVPDGLGALAPFAGNRAISWIP